MRRNDRHRTAVLITVVLTLLLAPLAGAASSRMRIDRNHSSVAFQVPILGGLSTVTGKFTDFELELDYDADDPAASSVRARIAASSIDTGIERRDNHLRTADFFDVDNHPDLTFASQRVEASGDGWTVHGVLTMRGVERPTTLDLQIVGINGRSTGFKATTTLDRTDFGIAWQHGDIPMFVGHEIVVELFVLASLPGESS